MRKTIIFLLVSIGVNSQFNYQALIKHSSGQIISNNQVKVKFSLMYQSTTATPFFVEEHIVNIPADGVVNLSVGGGTIVNGTYSNIDWSQSVFMKEELDTGNGYQDMGTKQVATVPIAEYAKITNISSQTFVTGNSNIQIGTIIGQSNGGHNNIAIGKNSLLNANGTSRNISIGEDSMKDNAGGATNVSIGSLSLSNNTSGNSNVSIGYANSIFNETGSRNVNIGEYSGYNNESGSNNVNIGYRANYQNQGSSSVNHSNVTTLGANTLINGISITNSTAIGANAIVTSSNTIQLGNADVTLVNTSGVVSAAGLNIGGTAITSTASELNLLHGVSEIGVLASVSENNNTGVRLSSSNSSNHGDIGGDAVDLSKQGQSSSIRGATGYGSFASGFNTTASEYYSTALGSYTVASGYGSTAIGRYTTASGYYSVTMGNRTTASDWGSLVIGRYNLSSSSATSADSFSTSNPAFVIGNGSASSARSDAFKVMYNGDTTTSGIVSATGFKGSGDQLTLNDNGTITSLMQLIGDLKSEISALQQSNNSEIKSAQVKTNAANDVVLFELGVLRFSWNTTYNTIQVKQSSSSEIVDNWFISGVIRSGGSSGEYSPTETYIQKSNMTYGLGDGGGYNDRFTPIWSDGFTSLMEGSIALGSTYSNFEFYITPMGSGSSTQYDPVPTWQLRGHVDGYGQLTVTCIHAKFDGNSGW
tara:strand:- start:18094 stop:20202 length:2109 start_codon:yes stop_codon:yes gene_type:complete